MKKIILTLCCFLTVVLVSAQSQTFKWAKNFGDTLDDQGRCLATDTSGNVYITGEFKGTVDFDPGPGTFNLTAAFDIDMFISKFDANGNFIWAKKFGSSGYDAGLSITVDKSGNIYTTGYFNYTVDFDPGAGTFNLSSAGAGDIVILKLNKSGNFVWAKRLGGTNAEYAHSIKVDASGNIYTTGYFFSTVDFDPGAATYNLTAAAGCDMFISKLDTGGNFLWAKRFGGSYDDIGYSLCIDALGNIYTTGSFTSTVDFDPGVGTYNLTSASTTPDIFVLKLTSSGNFGWAKKMGTTYNDAGRGLLLDSAYVYLTGNFGGTVDFDPGTGTFNLTAGGVRDIFVSKLDTSGNFVWAKKLSGTNDLDYGYSIASDTFGNIYTTGCFSGTVDFDPGTGTYNLTAGGTSWADIFISKLNAAGNFVWAKKLEGVGASTDDVGYSIAVDPSGNVYTTGYFGGTVDFDPGTATFNLSSKGLQDIFIHKLAFCQPSYSTSTITACDSLVFNSQTYKTTGSYVQTITNSTGCDSIITLDLLIKKSSSSVLAQSACVSYTLNAQTYNTSGVYTQKLTNSKGCDSVITLNLTIKQATTSSTTQTACFKYTFNSQVYTSSGVYTQKLVNAAGCDSNLTLNLTINTVNNAVTKSGATLTAAATGASYQWTKCPSYAIQVGATNQSFTPTSNGDYAVIITQNSCKDTSNCITVTGVGIDNYSFDEMNILPNPTHGLFNVNVSNYSKIRIEIYNSLGMLIYKRTNLNETNTFDFTNKPNGLYFIKVIDSENKVSTGRIVKTE